MQKENQLHARDDRRADVDWDWEGNDLKIARYCKARAEGFVGRRVLLCSV